MTRLFVFLIVILALGFGFAWVADHPGMITLNWQGQNIRTSLMVFVVALVALIAVILIIWGIFRGVFGFPSVLTRFLINRRRDRGYQALSKGLIAAGTGDKNLARQLTKESSKLLANEPLVKLLDAQTALLEGNRDAARGQFQAMLDNDETKLLGLRGLYLEAEREGAREASQQYADEASQLAPTLGWAGHAKLRNLSLNGDWENALNTLETNRSAGLVEKEPATRQRAVLLTARAIAEEPTNPTLAAKLAKEAHRLAPDLVPAAVIGATALVRGNKLRKASKLVESVWKKSPHPELAELYIHMRAGDSVSDRLKRARSLAKLSANHAESNIAIAHAAIDAKDWDGARDAMKGVLNDQVTERACLIMADIEEGEHGDAGRMRDWLSRAVRAQRDAKWTAGGYTSEFWLPVSPQTGEIDAFEWKIPTEQLQLSEDTLDIGDLAEPLKQPIAIAPASAKVEPIEPPKDEATQTVDAKPDPQPEPDTKADTAKVVAGIAGASLAASALAVDKQDKAPDAADEKQAQDTDTKDKLVEDAVIVELVPSTAKKDNDTTAKPENKPAEIIPSDDEATTAVFALERRPDDPGVDPENADDKKGFKIF